VSIRVFHLVYQKRKDLLSSGLVNCKILSECVTVPLFYKLAVMLKRLLINPVILSLTDSKLSLYSKRAVAVDDKLPEPANE
jgi:hypothetical protein